MKTIYYARLSYGDPVLTEVLVEEKPKTYQTISKESILGPTHYVYTRLWKDSPNLFLTKDEALDYLWERTGEYINGLIKKLEKSRESYTELTKMRYRT